jgi:fumarate reductase flavoprotein subunit
MSILPVDSAEFDAHLPVLIIGAGAAGHVAALAARDAGIDCIMLERDRLPRGSTALSSGLVPAAGTSMQRARGIEDDAVQFAADIQRKAHEEADPGIVAALTETIGPAVDWLATNHGVPFELVEGFLYPGHSVLRMHGTPKRTGAELIEYLIAAAARAGAETLTDAHVESLFASDDGRVVGVRIRRPNGTTEDIGCAAVVLACNGFGGNPSMVRDFIPEMADALFFGHAGNAGDGILWGEKLGASLRHMGAYQGHGSVASPHGILITWATMMEGGIQVNVEGRRFSDEHKGYSEQSVAVLQQPGGIAFDIYDRRCHQIALQFEDYRNAVAAGAVREAADVRALARELGLPEARLAATLEECRTFASGDARDPFGRSFADQPAFTPPFYGVRVTGALFHTQGGLVVDRTARVVRSDRSTLPNVFAAGGVACGVSGSTVAGYLSGNGLLAAIGLGRLAGQSAAYLVKTVSGIRIQ